MCFLTLTYIYQISCLCNNVHWLSSLKNTWLAACPAKSNSYRYTRLRLSKSIYPLFQRWQSILKIVTIIFGRWSSTWWESSPERTTSLLIQFELRCYFIHVSCSTLGWMTLACATNRVSCVRFFLFYTFVYTIRCISRTKINLCRLFYIWGNCLFNWRLKSCI